LWKNIQKRKKHNRLPNTIPKRKNEWRENKINTWFLFVNEIYSFTMYEISAQNFKNNGKALKFR